MIEQLAIAMALRAIQACVPQVAPTTVVVEATPMTMPQGITVAPLPPVAEAHELQPLPNDVGYSCLLDVVGDTVRCYRADGSLIQEDEPEFDCTQMGNRVCGPVGAPLVTVRTADGRTWYCDAVTPDYPAWDICQGNVDN